MTKQIVAAAAAALTLASAAAFAAPATPPMHSPMMHKPMMHTMHKPMMASKGVYVCKTCKAYYSPTQAKTMGYKDSMGHKLTKMGKAPAGFMDGSKMKM